LHRNSASQRKNKPPHEGNTEIAKNDGEKMKRNVEKKVEKKTEGKTT
jgi:hypothetical protein|tara:strand:- start:342 stop:482 length:141 start_codon:yes stop_codon:yes gene_type:complete